MQYYMIENERFNNDKVNLDKDEIHHIYNVMRAKQEDKIICVNIETAKKYLCVLGEIKNEANIVEELIENNELKKEIILAFGLVSADKFEFVLQKAAELGVSKFIPIINDYSVAKIDEKKLQKKLVRWHKIVKEACEQARRNKLMQIERPIKIDELSTYKQECNIVAFEKAKSTNKITQEMVVNQTCLLVVGPEGGISYREIELLKEMEFKKISLGKRILRTETAAISLVSIVSNYME